MTLGGHKEKNKAPFVAAVCDRKKAYSLEVTVIDFKFFYARNARTLKDIKKVIYKKTPLNI